MRFKTLSFHNARDTMRQFDYDAEVLCQSLSLGPENSIKIQLQPSWPDHEIAAITQHSMDHKLREGPFKAMTTRRGYQADASGFPNLSLLSGHTSEDANRKAQNRLREIFERPAELKLDISSKVNALTFKSSKTI